jgi:hypothetical protein
MYCHTSEKLRTGLRYIARSDILLDGGRPITLDELSDAHGLPRLPLLEDMPDELEVDREKDAAEASMTESVSLPRFTARSAAHRGSSPPPPRAAPSR